LKLGCLLRLVLHSAGVELLELTCAALTRRLVLH
jgi:hypothetical protein